MGEVPESPHVRWVTSSHSSGNAQCVEAALLPGRRLVRDSKQGESGPVLGFTDAGWRSLLTNLRAHDH